MRISMRISALAISLSMGYLLPTAAAGRNLYQQPDNTKTNKQQKPTADDQKEDAADREMVQKIRRSILDDKSLSQYAHNVKVIVRGGMVTLKGPVQNEDEKKAVADKAAEIAGGSDKVQNDLVVK
jgi:hyperosmotically inducible periplasmic protein